MPGSRTALLEQARRAFDDRDPAAAFTALAPLRPALDSDRELAVLWLTLLRVAPDRAELLEDARAALRGWPGDPEIVLPACDALIRSAERGAPDAPAPPDGAAATAAQAARACLDAGAGSPELEGYLQINLANALRLQREFEPAQAAFERALALKPDNGAWWFNLGLLHKARGAFAEGLQANERARALMGDEKPVLWNLAICAIACGRSEQARQALRALGHRAEIGEGGMPFVDGLPPMQVRVATVGSGLGPERSVPHRSVSFELLWVTPLSPCHGVISSASYRVASVDYGDVVLWDGVVVGVGEYEGTNVPRFPLLAVLRKGEERRYRFVGLQQHAGGVEALARELPEGSRLFVHSERVEHVCPRCASGEHAAHRHMPPEAHHLVYGKLVIAPEVELAGFRHALHALLHRHPGVQLVVPELLEALGESEAAGKAHQMWRGLERTADKGRAT